MEDKVLIIDDSDIWRAFLSHELSKLGYTVMEATDGIDGINKFFKFLPNAVVVDYVMPKLNGIQFTRFIKSYKFCENVGIALLTAVDTPINKFWAKKSGVDIFISKSDSKEIILENIKKFLEKPHSLSWDREIYKIHAQPYGELIDILDKSLKYSTLLAEFVNIFPYIFDEKLTFEKINNLFNELFEFSNVYFSIFTPSRLRIYNFSNDPANYNEVANFIYKNHIDILPFTKITSNFEGNNKLSKNLLSFKIEYNSTNIGIVVFENPQEIEQLIDYFQLSKKTLSNLFYLLNDYYYFSESIVYDDFTKFLTFPAFRTKLQQTIDSAKRNNIDFNIFTVEIDNVKGLSAKLGKNYVLDLIKNISEKLNTLFPDMVGRISQNKFACINLNKSNLNEIQFENIKIKEIDWKNKSIIEIINELYK